MQSRAAGTEIDNTTDTHDRASGYFRSIDRVGNESSSSNDEDVDVDSDVSDDDDNYTPFRAGSRGCVSKVHDTNTVSSAAAADRYR